MIGVATRGLAAPLLAAALAACGGVQETTVHVTTSPLVITDTATPRPVGALQLTVTGQPTRTFLITGGRWKVCDKGTVTNGGSLVATDVRIVALYVDKGVTVGTTTRDDAEANGGALGSIPPGESRPFTYCGITRNEPDVDTLTATSG